MFMETYKINRQEEIRNFVPTRSYYYLLETFKELKEVKGEIFHVIGAPGTGKSTNIYKSIEELDLNVYELKLPLSCLDSTSRDVFELMIQSIREDLQITSSEHVLPYLGKFDMILFADKFHDAHMVHKNKFGFSQWTDHKGLKSLNFYLICIYEYLKHRRDFKNINIVLQTAWRVHCGGKKKDLFTDLGFLSELMVKILGVPFTVIKISYSEKETINIVKSHLRDADPDEIKQYIKKYGMKPRFICQKIENDF
jgi:hypothetical protein